MCPAAAWLKQRTGAGCPTWHTHTSSLLRSVIAQDKKAKSGAGRAKKPSVPWPLVPSKVLGDGEIDGLVTEKQPIFFLMARPQPRAPPGAEPPKPKLMQLKKLPQRCHYQVCSVLGTDLPTGEAVAVSEAAALKKLSERWAAMLKKYPKDPQPVLPGEDSDGGPMVNLLVQKTLAVRNDRLENLKKRKEVTQKTGNKKFPEADLYRAMLQCHNDDSDAAKLLTRMQANENTVLDRRKGHATRDMVRYALQTCDNDADMAEYMLKHQEKKLSKHTDNIFAQRGMSAIGYPSRQVRHLSVTSLPRGLVPRVLLSLPRGLVPRVLLSLPRRPGATCPALPSTCPAHLPPDYPLVTRARTLSDG